MEDIPAARPCCDNGYQWVEEIAYRPVKVQRCRIVCETKPVKQVVYDIKTVPYCLHRCPNPLRGTDCACDCETCPRHRRVLLKREIVVGQKTERKCVVEEDVEYVPYTVRRCVPSEPSSPPAAPVGDAVGPRAEGVGSNRDVTTLRHSDDEIADEATADD